MSSREEKDESESEQPLRAYQKVAFGAAMAIPAMGFAMWYTYIVSFLEKVLGLPASSTGTVVLIGQTAGGLTAPLVGLWSDQISCRYGRRKTTYLIGAVAMGLSFFFLWHECITCENTPSVYQTIYFTSFATVYQFGTSTTQTAMFSLIPELGTDKRTYVELSMSCTVFTCLSHLLVFGCVWGLLAARNDGGMNADEFSSQDHDIFMMMALVILGVGVVTAAVFLFCAPERPTANPPKLAWYKWFGRAQFHLVTSINVAAQIVYSLPKAYMPLYLLYTLKMDKASIAKGPIVLYVSAFLSSLLTKGLNRIIGLKMLYALCQVFPLTSIVWFWFMGSTDDSKSTFNWRRDSIYIAFAILGMGIGMLWIACKAFVADLVGKNTGSSAYIFGSQFTYQYLAAGLVVKGIQQGTPASESGLAAFYRRALVLPILAAVCLGSLSLVLLTCYEKWTSHSKKKSKSDANDVQMSRLGAECDGHKQELTENSATTKHESYTNETTFQEH